MVNRKLIAGLVCFFLGFLGVFSVSFEKKAAAAPAADKDTFQIEIDALTELLTFYAVNMLDPPADIGVCLQEMMAMRRLGGCRDKFSYYIPKEEVKNWNEDMRGEFGGIGVEITQKDGQVVIVSPMENAPGERAGLKPEDVLLAADGKDLENVQQAARLLRGPVGSKVEIKYWRKGFAEPKTIIVVREKITVQAVKFRDLSASGKKVRVIKVTSFEDKTYGQFRDALSSAKAAGIKLVALDFRNNPGGALDQALQMLALFMRPNDLALTFRTRDKAELYDADYLSNRFGIVNFGEFRDLKIVILINKGSASASEIFAGTMQDWGYTVIGEGSFKKGVGQTCRPLSDGALLCLTTFEFLVGNNKVAIRDVGVIPNIDIKKSDDKNKDEQLDKAVEILVK